MVSPPREPRDTFDLLSRLQSGDDLDRLLGRIDWRRVPPRQISHAVLGHAARDVPCRWPTAKPFDPRLGFKALLLCPEFQADILSNLLRAYPEKPRRFFVHVPRSGGTSLGETLDAHGCLIPCNALGADWSGGRPFLDTVGAICRKIDQHDTIHVSGHYTLRSLIDGHLIRAGDAVWTSLRNPVHIIVSYMNHILTTLHGDPDLVRPDARDWAEALGLRTPVALLSAERVRGLLPRMIQDTRLLPRNPLCHFLGDGTAAGALHLLAAAEVEIIATGKLDQWRERRWDTACLARANASSRFFAWSTLGDSERRRISDLVTQDMVLYRSIRSTCADAISVNGRRLARAQPAASPILPDAGVLRARMPGGSGPRPRRGSVGGALRLALANTRAHAVCVIGTTMWSRLRIRKPGGSL